MITSKADEDKNTLETGTLTWSDVETGSKWEVKTQGGDCTEADKEAAVKRRQEIYDEINRIEDANTKAFISSCSANYNGSECNQWKQELKNDTTIRSGQNHSFLLKGVPLKGEGDSGLQWLTLLVDSGKISASDMPEFYPKIMANYGKLRIVEEANTAGTLALLAASLYGGMKGSGIQSNTAGTMVAGEGAAAAVGSALLASIIYNIVKDGSGGSNTTNGSSDKPAGMGHNGGPPLDPDPQGPNSSIGITITAAAFLQLIQDAEKISTAKPEHNQSATPRNLKEKVFYDSVIKNPGGGTRLSSMNNDPRFPTNAGFQKMTQSTKLQDGTSMTIHYQYNTITGKVYDAKFTTPRPQGF